MHALARPDAARRAVPVPPALFTTATAALAALAFAGCMAPGRATRSTTVRPDGARRAAVAEHRGGAAARWATGSAARGGGGGGGGGDRDADGYAPVTTVAASATYGLGPPDEGAPSGYGFEDEEVTADLYRPASGAATAASPPEATVARIVESETGRGEDARRYADAARAARVTASAGDVAEALATATDATPAGPLLIYTASLWLAVYEVRESQATITARAEALGGFVQRQTDTELVLRVPAARFDALVEAATGVGDLLHREIAADDVSEEYRDVEIRIRNLEAMRDRLEVLLTQATAVEDALRVERELERVTVELERLRGRQRFLSDRIALATITVHFEARPRDRIDQPEIFALPFTWLERLGLPSLLELH